MKTEQQINEARTKVISRILQSQLIAADQRQLDTLQGMLVALVWCADGANASTMELVLSDRPIVTR